MHALLFLLPLLVGTPQDEPAVDPLAVNKAIDRGVDWLLRIQRMDGSWLCHEPDKYPAGQTALTLYTLLKCGVPQWHPAVHRALAYLRAVPARKTYSVGCLLMALNELDGDNEAWIRANVDFLLEALRPNSYAAYPEGGGDLSNTQYLALGLRVAVQRGMKVPAKHFERLANLLLRNMQYGGGWGYRAGSKPTGSMTVAGVATLLICLEGLAATGKDGPWRARVQSAVSQAEAWLAKHFSPTANPRPHEEKPGADSWKYYYLYGVERFGAFAGLTRFGKYDWYQLGAAFLLDKQQKAGSWPSPWGTHQEFDTCFALLFLKRATAIATGEVKVSNRFINTFGKDDPKAEVSIRGDLEPREGYLQMWISSFGDRPKLLYEWEEDEGRGLRVAAVRWFVNGEQVERREGSTTRPAGANRFPARLKIAENGSYTVQALVDILPGGARAEDTIELRSPEIEARVDLLYGRREQGWVNDLGVNLLRPELIAATSASTQHDSGWWAADKAVDGSMGTGWLCQGEDEIPFLDVRFTRPVTARTLKLSHTRPRPDRDAAKYGAAAKVIVRINGKRKIHATLTADRLEKQVVDLGSRRSIRRLEIHVLERHARKDAEMRLGFQELELFR